MKPALPLALATVLVGGASLVWQGSLPGDAALTQGLQAVFGTSPGWASCLTMTAKAPILWGTLALAAALAWRVAGLHGALAAALAYGLAFAADRVLRALVFVPRPDPAVVAVAEPAASSGLPSTFGLVYGAMFGAALLARSPARRARPARVLAAVLLVVGVSARIVMGGHWGSQMLASAALGLLLALAALMVAGAVTRRLPRLSRA